jgi:hypothetical protein
VQIAIDQGFSAQSQATLSSAVFGNDSSSSSNQNSQNPAGASSMVAPGQTITLGGAGGNVPPPATVQASFDQGFSAQSLETLSSAVFGNNASSSSNQNSQNAAGGSSVVAPGQTITLGGAAGNTPPPATVQAAFDQGFSAQSRATLSNAASGQ